MQAIFDLALTLIFEFDFTNNMEYTCINWIIHLTKSYGEDVLHLMLVLSEIKWKIYFCLWYILG